MAHYGVSTTNVFDLLDDERPQQSQPKPAAAKQAAPVKSTAKSAPQSAGNDRANDRSSDAQSRSNNNRGGRGGRGGNRGGQAGRNGQQSRGFSGETVSTVDTDASAGGYSEVSGDHEKRSRQPGQGGRGRGNGGRGRGFGDGSRREFDRRGAPRGRGPFEPRKGGMALGDPAEIPETTETTPAPAGDADAVATETPAEEVAVEIEEVAAAPEDTSLTYDEFLEQQRAKQVADDLADRVRRVEIDESQWKAVKPLNSGKTETSEESARVAKAKKSKGKVSLDEFVGSPVGGPPPREHREYDDSQRGGRRGGRGGRGGASGGDRGDRSDRSERGSFRGDSRGGRPRGGERGSFRGGRGGSRGANVNILDESAFPALGGK